MLYNHHVSPLFESLSDNCSLWGLNWFNLVDLKSCKRKANLFIRKLLKLTTRNGCEVSKFLNMWQEPKEFL